MIARIVFGKGKRTLDSSNDSATVKATAAASQPAGTPANALNLKGFNSVGREDTSYDVLKPQSTAAQRRTTLLLAMAAIILLCVVGALAFSRSHLTLPSGDQQGPKFAPPAAGGN